MQEKDGKSYLIRLACTGEYKMGKQGTSKTKHDKCHKVLNLSKRVGTFETRLTKT